jgi:hypothetical protein
MIQNLIQTLGLWLPLILLWSIFWKGLALWHSAQRRQSAWFIILIIINTLGILEIIYLFGVLKLTFSTLFTKDIQK